MIIDYLHIIIMLTMAVGIIVLFKTENLLIPKIIVGLLSYSLITEVAANVLWIKYNANNTMVYNFYVAISFTFWIYVFQKQKRIWLIILYLTFFWIDFIFLHGSSNFVSYAYLLGTYLITYFQLHFFYKNFIHQQNDLSIHESELLLRMAVLMYHVGFSTLLFINDWGATNTYVFGSFTVYGIIALVINILYHTFIILYFLKLNKENRK